MTLVRKDKEKLMKKYKETLKGAKNIVVLKQFGLPVNQINSVRMDIEETKWKLLVVKKRIFLNVVKESWYEGWDLEKMEDSIVILYSYEDEYSPLKVIAKYVKQWKKEEKKFWFEYLGWWFDNSWKEKDYVSDLASLPTKPELVWKFLFLLNYPLQWLAVALDQIAKKKEGWN